MSVRNSVVLGCLAFAMLVAAASQSRADFTGVCSCKTPGSPGAEYPFAYGQVHDPLTGRTQGILDRCTSTNTCPKVVHAATALEMWELRQSLGFTDR